MKKTYFSALFFLLFPQMALTSEFYDDLRIGVLNEQNGVNTFALEALYPLPFLSTEEQKRLFLGSSYATNRLNLLTGNRQPPIDFLEIKAKYYFPLNKGIDGFTGIRGRFSRIGLDQELFPELMALNPNSFSLGINPGLSFLINRNLSLVTELTINYPPSFSLPILSYGCGIFYQF